MEEQENTSQNKPQRDQRGRLLPGFTANPNGRPPGSISITAEIKRRLNEVPEGQQKSYLEILVGKILKKAIQEEDFQTMKEIWNHTDGLPKIGIESSLKSEITVTQNINLLEKLLLSLDDDTRNKINARLLEIADDETGNFEPGLQTGLMQTNREGNLLEEGSNEELEAGQSSQ
ncbi:MAG: hypothetical protein ABSA74_00285 [Candidatus Staskawiczbacteria bacterium]